MPDSLLVDRRPDVRTRAVDEDPKIDAGRLTCNRCGRSFAYHGNGRPTRNGNVQVRCPGCGTLYQIRRAQLDQAIAGRPLGR